jgi:cell filamentation protein
VSDDPYVYPGTDVLRNELGIRDADEPHRVESDLTYWRALRLASTPIRGSYDLAHLQACHRTLFAALYAWAGQLRTVRMAKPTCSACRSSSSPRPPRSSPDSPASDTSGRRRQR